MDEDVETSEEVEGVAEVVEVEVDTLTRGLQMKLWSLEPWNIPVKMI